MAAFSDLLKKASEKATDVLQNFRIGKIIINRLLLEIVCNFCFTIIL